jgi:catalase-peroxidase
MHSTSKTPRFIRPLTMLLLTAMAACQQSAPPSESESEKTPQENTPEEPQTDAAAKVDPMEAKPNDFWWPESLDLQPLRDNSPESNPLGPDFDYRAEFAKVDYAQLKTDLEAILTDSKDWWPADYGNYGPLFIRMAWHSAGTYRVSDGRGGADGGQQRFKPLNSWPDNANLDKARRLLWPVKKKYGHSVSWADLIILSANVAMEQMGFETLGFSGGRVDDWEADLVYWGPETEMLGSSPERFHGGEERTVAQGLGASHMGLIYVNPEGPDGNPDPVKAAYDIRSTFGNMAMNDEETVALIAGGHTFGKVHGARPMDCLGEPPAASDVEMQGFGWHNECGKGNAEDTTTSGLEGAWTSAPVSWTHQYLSNLFSMEWSLTKSPAGAHQWEPEGEVKTVPDAHVAGKMHEPMMLTTDLSMRMDPKYQKIAKRFLENRDEFEEAFAKAWFKLIHRDLGPKSRYVGPEVPEEDFLWQDPVPAVDHRLIDARDATRLKKAILASGISVPDLVRTAWAAASSYRATDMRGGANGARVRLAPQKDWAANDPETLSAVLEKLDSVRTDFNASLKNGKEVSLADVIVLGGAAAIEKAAGDAGLDVTVPFAPGRTDASQEQTDVDSFSYLEPKFDGFRNYYAGEDADERGRSPSQLLIEKADLMGLTVPEMTVLVGGMRALDANTGGARAGVFTKRPGALSNDFFVNLLDMDTKWSKTGDNAYEGVDRKSGDPKWTATEVDLVFGSNSELRAVAEVYAYDQEKFADDFVSAWTKVMQADRFDLE